MNRRRFAYPFALLIAGSALMNACGSDDASTSGDGDGGEMTEDGGPGGGNTDGTIVLPDGRVVTPDGSNPTTDGSMMKTDAGPMDESGAETGTDSSTDDTGTDSGTDTGVDADDGATADTGVDTGVDANDGAIPDGPDQYPGPFPTTTPELFGYTLKDAFPCAGGGGGCTGGTQFVSGAMVMQWPQGSSQPFVLDRGGYVVRLHADNTGNYDIVLDISANVAFVAEAGALGFALHPKFTTGSPYAYIWYNWTSGNPFNPVLPTHQRLSRFTWNGTKFVSELVLVDQMETDTEHNGARIAFGPDGFLYFANGDDTRPGTTTDTITGALFSGMFRIDVDMQGGAVSHPPTKTSWSTPSGVASPANVTTVTQGYYIPNDNPFVGVPNAAEEYFALGFRNPYAFSFDSVTGDIYEGDVGETFREEVNHILPGGNYGWPYYEGELHQKAGNPTIGNLYAPLHAYSHASMADSVAVMGGFVYRGTALPELVGKYIYSDWPTGRVWALDTATGARVSLTEANWQNAPVGFGQDANGELYIIAWSHIFKLVHAAPHNVPLTLSATNIYRNFQTMKTSSSLVPYTIRSPLWSDGAAKQRMVAIPPGQTATMNSNGNVTLPQGSLMVKQFDLPAGSQPTGGRTSLHLETRVMVVASDETYGLTYRWRLDGSDADLVTEAVDETITDAALPTRQWHTPSFGECWQCHRADTANGGGSPVTDVSRRYRILGFRGEQLNYTPPATGVNQLTTLAGKNVFDGVSIGTAPAPLADPSDTTATIDARGQAYIATNCSHCHHLPGAQYLGGTTWNALPGVAIGSRGLVNVQNHNSPAAVNLGLGAGAVLIKPNTPAQSMLMGRVNSVDPDLRMPPVQRTIVDPVGQSVINSWITAGPP